MSMLKFAEEFTRLIIRYTRTSPNNEFQLNAVAPLTNEQIIFTIQHVLQALSIKGLDNKNNNNLLEFTGAKLPTNLESSIVNIEREPDIENMYRSQDAQSVFTDNDSSVSDISKTSKNEQENSLQNGKKFLSQSNPAICINNISRSDTFVREENGKMNTEDQEDVFEDVTSDERDDLLNNFFQVSLNEIRKSAMSAMNAMDATMAKLNNLEQSFPHSIRLPKEVKIRQLSNGHSSPHRISTMNTTKVLTNIRSLSSDFPRTSTSPKLLAIKNGNISERRKSTGGIRINAPPDKSCKSKTGYSVLNLTSSYNKVSPSSSVEFQPKFTKNPKYAHVRSTIPKAIIQRKNMHNEEAIKRK